MSGVDPSLSASSEVIESLFRGERGALLSALRAALAVLPAAELLHAAAGAWLDRRGRGGTTGANALLTLLAARDLGARLGPDRARAAAVVSLGFLQQAAALPRGAQDLPGPEALDRWTGWGEAGLLRSALHPAGTSSIDLPLCRLACRQVAARPDLRTVRGLLLAEALAGRSASAAERVRVFLLDPRSGGEPGRPTPPEPAAVDDALRQACRLDPHPTLGHAMQLAAACQRLRSRSDELGEEAGAALVASGSTWPRLQRAWSEFLRSSRR